MKSRILIIEDKPALVIALQDRLLLNEVWGRVVSVTTRTGNVHIAWLRQKLVDNPRYPQHLLTVYGLGYKFEN